MELSQETINNLLCSNCGYVISFGPVYSTATGRHLCGRCSLPQDTQENYMRSILFEKLAMDMTFPCKNTERGCEVLLKPNVLRNHEGMCQYNRYGCPQNTLDNHCDWLGLLEDIAGHYQDKHPSLLVSHPVIKKPDIKKNYVHYFVFTYLNFSFLLQQKCNKHENMLWHNVLFLGPPHQAELFTYGIKLTMDMDVLIKNKRVQPCGGFAMGESTSLKHRINNIFQEIGAYDDVEFSLSVSMKELKCVPCGRVMDSGPIHYTDSGEYWCPACFNAPQEVETLVWSRDVQTDMLSTQDKQIQTDRYKCSDCGAITDSVVGGRCRWGDLVHRLKDNTNNTGQIKCKNSGCTYSHNDRNVVRKHSQYLCTFDKNTCNTCKENFSSSQFLHHLVQKHGVEIPAVVSEEMATVHFTHTLLTTGSRSHYIVHIRELLIYVYIYHASYGIWLFNPSYGIRLDIMTDTQLLAHQHLNITCTITSDQTKTSRIIVFTNDTTVPDDWHTQVKENNFTQSKNNNIDLNFVIKIKK